MDVCASARLLKWFLSTSSFRWRKAAAIKKTTIKVSHCLFIVFNGFPSWNRFTFSSSVRNFNEFRRKYTYYFLDSTALCWHFLQLLNTKGDEMAPHSAKSAFESYTLSVVAYLWRWLWSKIKKPYLTENKDRYSQILDWTVKGHYIHITLGWKLDVKPPRSKTGFLFSMLIWYSVVHSATYTFPAGVQRSECEHSDKISKLWVRQIAV